MDYNSLNNNGHKKLKMTITRGKMIFETENHFMLLIHPSTIRKQPRPSRLRPFYTSNHNLCLVDFLKNYSEHGHCTIPLNYLREYMFPTFLTYSEQLHMSRMLVHTTNALPGTYTVTNAPTRPQTVHPGLHKSQHGHEKLRLTITRGKIIFETRNFFMPLLHPSTSGEQPRHSSLVHSKIFSILQASAYLM
jgi:hypothetical protein